MEFRRLGYRKILLACSLLLFLSLVSWQVFSYHVILSASDTSGAMKFLSLFCLSNHFTISPDFVAALSSMILIALHIFKLEKPSGSFCE